MSTHGKSSRKLKFEIMQRHFQDSVKIKELAAMYGLPAPTVYGWRKQYREHGANAFIGCGHRRATEDELSKLRSANVRLRNENKRLKSQLEAQENI
jgi:transposase-like protein